MWHARWWFNSWMHTTQDELHLSPSILTGVSAANDYDVNSLAVPRRAKEAIGAITRLTYPDGRCAWFGGCGVFCSGQHARTGSEAGGEGVNQGRGLKGWPWGPRGGQMRSSTSRPHVRR